jgi:hypothetical protein
VGETACATRLCLSGVECLSAKGHAPELETAPGKEVGSAALVYGARAEGHKACRREVATAGDGRPSASLIGTYGKALVREVFKELKEEHRAVR